MSLLAGGPAGSMNLGPLRFYYPRQTSDCFKHTGLNWKQILSLNCLKAIGAPGSPNPAGEFRFTETQECSALTAQSSPFPSIGFTHFPH